MSLLPINCNQSGFRPADSCVNQLLPITHEIYKSFWCQSLTWSKRCSLDVSKAFDRIWHDNLLHKLKLLGICGRYYNLIQSFSSNRHQRVLLNGQSSNWSRYSRKLNFGPATLPCLHYDLIQGFRCNAKLFAGNTSLFSTITSPTISSSNLNQDYWK